jgi:hypothetical protein
MTLVTISASYGAGGSRVAPALARELGVPLLGRPDLGEAPDDEEQAGDEWIGSGAARLLSRLASRAVSWGTPPGMTADELLPDGARRQQLEQEIRDFAAAGAGVVLGRGAAVVLRDEPRVLHVLLDGPREARIVQAMEIERIDRRTAEERRERVDRFRRAYLEDLYGVDVRDPGVFELVIDSTALALDACVAVIATAARSR